MKSPDVQRLSSAAVSRHYLETRRSATIPATGEGRLLLAVACLGFAAIAVGSWLPADVAQVADAFGVHHESKP